MARSAAVWRPKRSGPIVKLAWWRAGVALSLVRQSMFSLHPPRALSSPFRKENSRDGCDCIGESAFRPTHAARPERIPKELPPDRPRRARRRHLSRGRPRDAADEQGLPAAGLGAGGVLGARGHTLLLGRRRWWATREGVEGSLRAAGRGVCHGAQGA